MAQISQNKLTPLLVLIAAVVVGVILYKQGQSDAVPAGAPMEQVPEAGLPETERGADADTPDETLRTVVGETRALSAQLRELREENKRLRANSGRVAMDTMRAELRNELRGEIRAELRAKLEKVLGRELTPGSTERLDFADDPMMAAQVMQVIAAHQAEKQMGALGQQPAQAPQSSSADDTIAQLERLDALRQSGALSQAEFDEQKRKLL